MRREVKIVLGIGAAAGSVYAIKWLMKTFRAYRATQHYDFDPQGNSLFI